MVSNVYFLATSLFLEYSENWNVFSGFVEIDHLYSFNSVETLFLFSRKKIVISKLNVNDKHEDKRLVFVNNSNIEKLQGTWFSAKQRHTVAMATNLKGLDYAKSKIYYKDELLRAVLPNSAKCFEIHGGCRGKGG